MEYNEDMKTKSKITGFLKKNGGKVLTIATSAVIATLGVLSSISTYRLVESRYDLLKNQRFQPVVESTLGADMQPMRYFTTMAFDSEHSYVRLLPNEEEKVYVYIDDSVSARTTSNIHVMMSEMNKVFGMINDSYYFVPCSKEEYDNCVEKKKSAIHFSYEPLTHMVYGKISEMYATHNEEKKTAYIYNSTIILDSNQFDDLKDVEQLFILKHELMRCLGCVTFDEYNYDETSILDKSLIGISTHLSPKDLKMLYVAYGNKHVYDNGFLNRKALNEVKAKIDQYEEMYYSYLMKQVTNIANIDFDPISLDDVNGTKFVKGRARITVENGEYKCVMGTVTSKGRCIVGENYIILPDVDSGGGNDFLVIANYQGQIQCFDLQFVHVSKNSINEELNIYLK